MLEKVKKFRLKNKVAYIVHDRLIIYEKQKGNDISEAQGVPWIAFKWKRIDCGYLTNNVSTQNLSKMNPLKDFEQITFNPFKTHKEIWKSFLFILTSGVWIQTLRSFAMFF